MISQQIFQKQFDQALLPRHVAIIMDGNRRWARQKGYLPVVGHWRGAETLMKITEIAASLGIKVLTVYAFSTENWKRSIEEVNDLMQLLKNYLLMQKDLMLKEGVRLQTIGDLSYFPEELKVIIEKVKKETEKGEKINLVLALNYGARDEICRAARTIFEDIEKGLVKKEDVSEQLFSRYLDTAPWGDPDLLIRTSGELRVSNFLLWQISYAEVYVTETLWPDFQESDFLAALLNYQNRERRQGE